MKSRLNIIPIYLFSLYRRSKKFFLQQEFSRLNEHFLIDCELSQSEDKDTYVQHEEKDKGKERIRNDESEDYLDEERKERRKSKQNIDKYEQRVSFLKENLEELSYRLKRMYYLKEKKNQGLQKIAAIIQGNKARQGLLEDKIKSSELSAREPTDKKMFTKILKNLRLTNDIIIEVHQANNGLTEQANFFTQAAQQIVESESQVISHVVEKIKEDREKLDLCREINEEYEGTDVEQQKIFLAMIEKIVEYTTSKAESINNNIIELIDSSVESFIEIDIDIFE